MAYSSRASARFSTYSGAPSIQPSLAPTLDTLNTMNSSNRASTQPLRQSYIATATTNPSPQQLLLPPKDHKRRRSAAPAMYTTPDAQASSSTVNSNDPKVQDIKAWQASFERMRDGRLDKQRYVMSGSKIEEVGKIALGAKVERALGRRMTGQDAAFTKKTMVGGGVTEKQQFGVRVL